MYKCNQCKEFFEEPKEIYADVFYGDYDVARPCNTKISVCPYCENTGFEEVFKCEHCERYFTKFELEDYNDELLCDNCLYDELN